MRLRCCPLPRTRAPWMAPALAALHLFPNEQISVLSDTLLFLRPPFRPHQFGNTIQTAMPTTTPSITPAATAASNPQVRSSSKSVPGSDAGDGFERGGSRADAAAAPNPPVAASGAAGEEPEHACPICLTNAEDQQVAGEGPATCFGCGQSFCGECKPKMQASVVNCPTCRAPFGVSDKENFARLWKLVHDRSPGRHTPDAQLALGRLYDKGTGVRRDEKEGMQGRKTILVGCTWRVPAG